jgi:hypothetical protein
MDIIIIQKYQLQMTIYHLQTNNQQPITDNLLAWAYNFPGFVNFAGTLADE